MMVESSQVKSIQFVFFLPVRRNKSLFSSVFQNVWSARLMGNNKPLCVRCGLCNAHSNYLRVWRARRKRNEWKMAVGLVCNLLFYFNIVREREFQWNSSREIAPEMFHETRNSTINSSTESNVELIVICLFILRIFENGIIRTTISVFRLFCDFIRIHTPHFVLASASHK